MGPCKSNFLSLTFLFFFFKSSNHNISHNYLKYLYFREFQLISSTLNNYTLLLNQNIAYNCLKNCHNIVIILISVCVGERERGVKEILVQIKHLL